MSGNLILGHMFGVYDLRSNYRIFVIFWYTPNFCPTSGIFGVYFLRFKTWRFPQHKSFSVYTKLRPIWESEGSFSGCGLCRHMGTGPRVWRSDLGVVLEGFGGGCTCVSYNGHTSATASQPNLHFPMFLYCLCIAV